MKQIVEKCYKNAVAEARKSERALRQMQRSTYAEMIRCETKTYDQYRDCVSENRYLFDLEPMKFDQVQSGYEASIKADSRKECKIKIQSIYDKQKPDGKISIVVPPGTGLSSKDNDSSINLTYDCKLNERQCPGDAATRTSEGSPTENVKNIACQFLVSAASKSHSMNPANELNTDITENASIRKRKRDEDVELECSDAEKARKKAKIDSDHSCTSAVTQKNQFNSRIPVFPKKKRDTDITVNVKLGVHSRRVCGRKTECAAGPQAKNNQQSQLDVSSLIPVIRERENGEWVECNVNHPVKQSKSRIPLPIHQLGSRNDSNFAAHLKRIGAYKKLASIESKSLKSAETAVRS